MYIGQERQWKNDTNNEHFIILDINSEHCTIEYYTDKRIHTKTNFEIENDSIISEQSSFRGDECENIIEYKSGKSWLYDNRCRICKYRLRCQYL